MCIGVGLIFETLDMVIVVYIISLSYCQKFVDIIEISIRVMYANFWILICSRMGMKCSSGSRGTLNWKSLWMLTVIVSLWISVPLLFYLMGVASVQSRPQTRFVFTTFFHHFVSLHYVQISLTFVFLWLENIFCCSWKWKMGMKSTPCFIRQEVLLSERSDDISAILWIELVCDLVIGYNAYYASSIC